MSFRGPLCGTNERTDVGSAWRDRRVGGPMGSLTVAVPPLCFSLERCLADTSVLDCERLPGLNGIACRVPRLTRRT